MLRRLLLLLTLLALVGCRMPGLVPALSQAPGQVTAPGQTQALRGRVEAGAYRTQATLAEIGNGATVSLIDPMSGATLATTISDASGSFQLNFGIAFVPVSGQAYYLEALKGIKGGNTQFNQAGSDALRLRTLVFFQDSGPRGWKSLGNATPGDIALNKETTALSVALALKIQAGESLTLSDYIGALAVRPYASVGAVSDTDFNALLGLVSDAVDQDRDPIQYTVYDTVNHKFSQSWVGFSITDVTPKSGNINDTITITGSGFTSGAATVSVNGVPATILTLANDTITARVSPGSRTGPVSVQIGATLQAGPTFAISVNDGHRAYLNGKLYVANPNWGTVSEVAANGDVKTILTGLNLPMQVTAGPDDMLYVACKGANKVLKVDPTSYAQTDFAAVTSPYGLAFDSAGNLFVSTYQGSGAGTVVKLNSTGILQTTYTGFTNPTSLGFDYAGMLYVVEATGGITKLTPAGSDGAPRSALTSVVGPRGMAIDSGGYLFLASNDNNTVYRINGTSGSVSVFAMINKPGGLCFDASGNLYVSDTEKNLIYRFSPQGNLKTYAYGISNPRGLAIDPADGTIYVALNKSNAILKVNPADGVLKPFVTGIANPLTLNFRNNGMYIGQPDINTISFVNRAGQFSTVVTGVPSAAGADMASDNQVYVGRYARPDAWQPNRDPIYDGGYGVINTSGVLQPTRYPYVRNSHLRAIDAAGNIYEVSRSTNTLVAVLANPNGTKTAQRLYTFVNQPSDVTYDSSGNIYVSVQGDNKVYRFDKTSGYAVTALTGFNGPYSLTFSDAGVLYVSNKGDGSLMKVSSPASATTADVGWSRVIPGAIASPTQVMEIASMSGANAIYLACGAKVLKYDLVGDAFSNYLGFDMPETLTHLYARSNGVLYVRAWQSQTLYTIATDKTYSVSLIGNYGGSLDYDPSWNNYQANTYGAQIYKNGGLFFGALGLTHEVAADGDLLYLASQGTSGSFGGVFRYELTGSSPKELWIPGAGTSVFSLAVNTNRDLYVGSSDNHVYLVDMTGTATDKWNLGTLPYGLDIYNNTLWAAGANCQLYDMPVGGTATPHTYGLMGPTY